MHGQKYCLFEGDTSYWIEIELQKQKYIGLHDLHPMNEAMLHFKGSVFPQPHKGSTCVQKCKDIQEEINKNCDQERIMNNIHFWLFLFFFYTDRLAFLHGVLVYEYMKNSQNGKENVYLSALIFGCSLVCLFE